MCGKGRRVGVGALCGGGGLPASAARLGVETAAAIAPAGGAAAVLC